MAIPLGRPSPNASCDRPERRREGPPGISDRSGMPAAPTWSCSRWGFPCRRRCRRRGALLPHRFTLAARPACRDGLAVYFLWHFPWGRPRRALPGTVPPWSPDFPLPAQAQEAAIRPSGTRRFGLSRRLCQRLLGWVSDFERSCAGQSRETTSRQGVEQWRRAESASAFRRFDHGRSPVAAGSAPPPSHSAG